MWWYLIPAIISAVQGLAGAHSEDSQASIQNLINKANADASNKVRGARNELAVAKGRLARANQVESNRRVLAQGTRQRDAAMVNYLRVRDAAASADLEGQLQIAEQQGAAVAAQAFSGVSGSVVDMVNTSTRLRNARAIQALKQREKSMSIDAATEQANIQRATIESLDTSSIMDELDYNVDFAQISKGGNLFSALAPAASLFGQAMGNMHSGSSTTRAFSYANPPNEQVWIK